MKKVWGLMAAICILLSVSGQAYGQSLKDLLNSSTVKDAVTSVTGGKKLTVENLQGTWTYTCLLYTSPSPRDGATSRMPSSA